MSKKKIIIVVLVVVVCASLLAFVAFSVVAYLFALSIYNPQAVQKFLPKGLRSPTPYEAEWKAENCFDDPIVIALCRAIEKQDVKEMQRLIDSGADANTKGKDNMPLLLWAYPAGEKGMECLLKNGADPNVIFESSYGAPPDIVAPGSTLLRTAVISTSGGEDRFDAYVDLLLKYGADPNLGDEKPLNTAVDYGFTYGGRDALASLLKAGADVNLTNKGEGYDSLPITQCLTPLQTDLIFPLLEHGAIYDVNTPEGRALQRAFYNKAIKDPTQINYYPGNEKENIKKAIKWLEERGVSFDEPALEPEEPEKNNSPNAQGESSEKLAP